MVRNDYINPNGPRAIRETAICIKNNLNFLPASLPTVNVTNTVGIKIMLPESPLLTFFLSIPPQKTVRYRDQSRCNDIAEFSCQHLSPW